MRKCVVVVDCTNQHKIFPTNIPSYTMCVYLSVIIDIYIYIL